MDTRTMTRKLHPQFTGAYDGVVIKKIERSFGGGEFEVDAKVRCIVVERADDPSKYLVEFYELNRKPPGCRKKINSLYFEEAKEYIRLTGAGIKDGGEEVYWQIVDEWNETMR